MRVCVYACMCVCVYVCKYVCMYVCMYAFFQFILFCLQAHSGPSCPFSLLHTHRHTDTHTHSSEVLLTPRCTLRQGGAAYIFLTLPPLHFPSHTRVKRCVCVCVWSGVGVWSGVECVCGVGWVGVGVWSGVGWGVCVCVSQQNMGVYFRMEGGVCVKLNLLSR